MKLQLGAKLTKGLGAGANPEVGRKAALEDTEKIIEALEGSDMIFITTGLGGGTGSGAAPVVASLASELGALTVAVVTKPFAFEGKRRMLQAEQALSELVGCVDTVIVIPNERLMETVERGTSFFEAFRIADDILRQAVQGISDIITDSRHHQSRLRRRENHHAGPGLRRHGHRRCLRHQSRRGRRQSRHRQPAARRQFHPGRAGHPDQHHRSAPASRCTKCTKPPPSSRKPRTKTPTSSSAPCMDDAMKDSVKITVIAAGFKDANKKNIHQKPTFLAKTWKAGRDAQEPQVVQAHEEAPRPPQMPNVVHQVQQNVRERNDISADDLDVPTFLRRQAQKAGA